MKFVKVEGKAIHDADLQFCHGMPFAARIKGYHLLYRDALCGTGSACDRRYRQQAHGGAHPSGQRRKGPGRAAQPEVAAGALYKLNDATAYEIYYAALTGEMKSGAGLVESQMKMLKDPKALAKLGFEQGISFIPFAGIGYGAFKAIRKDDESPVRAAAALRLARDPDPKSAEALAKAAGDEEWMVRAAAIDAIGRRGDAALVKAVVPL